MPPKDRSLPREVEESAYNLRVAGMSERAVYETLRDTLEEPPSYRDLRALYRRENVYYRTDVATARRQNEFLTLSYREPQLKETHYSSSRDEALEYDKRPEAEDDFNRKYALGMLARAGVNPDDVADEAMADSLQSIYRGEGS